MLGSISYSKLLSVDERNRAAALYFLFAKDIEFIATYKRYP